jgi:membrane protease YdiL (CAAX protease family)
VEVLTILFALILLVGIALLIYWLAATSFGKTALHDSRPRRNAMAFYTPLVPFGVWLFLGGIGLTILDHFKKSLGDLQQKILGLSLTGIIAIILFTITIVIVRRYFARGFKGFGLAPRTIGRDSIGAVAKLLGVWPLVFVMLLATVAIGKLIMGPDFQIEKHEELEVLIQYPQWTIRLGVLLLAVVVAPLTEEMLFRGLFQSAFRNITPGPWMAIIASSVIFTMAHQNWEHWPALFVLAMGLGYAYEKSGSLFQSIFMHAIFNGAMITATLLQP